VKKQAEGIISEVVVAGEAVGHLVLLAEKPFGEEDGGVVQEEVCRGAGDPET
jgi:hypothetical protein